jgi:hypothetical protein
VFDDDARAATKPLSDQWGSQDKLTAVGRSGASLRSVDYEARPPVLRGTYQRLDERFHENDPMGLDPTLSFRDVFLPAIAGPERRPGIHSPCGGYGFRARLSRASRVTRAPE